MNHEHQNQNKDHERQKIVIVGGGVAGISAALELDRIGLEADITLVDNKTHFEYHSALYRAATGGSVMESCIAYEDIFAETNVTVLEDTIDNVVHEEKRVWGVSGSDYHYDSLILALGSQACYFGIPGLEQEAFEFKTTNDALRLRKHLEETFRGLTDASREEKNRGASITVVGGGATGVEIAGQLSEFCQNLAKEQGLDPSYVTIDLIEGKSRVLPMLSESASKAAAERLRGLGVNMFFNRFVKDYEDMVLNTPTVHLDTKTVVWTAGVRAHELYQQIAGINCDEYAGVEVDENFEVPEMEGIYVVGDGAQAQYGNMAQTAERQGKYAAKVIAEKQLMGTTAELPLYKAKRPVYVVPVGRHSAVAQWGWLELHGYLGWMLRRAADFRFFGGILPPAKALEAFRQGNISCQLPRKSSQEELDQSA